MRSPVLSVWFAGPFNAAKPLHSKRCVPWKGEWISTVLWTSLKIALFWCYQKLVLLPPPAKHLKMYQREICLFRRVDKLVEAQLAEHEPPKLAGWTRFPIGSYRRLKCGTFGLSSFMLSVDIWVQGASKAHGRYRPLVAIQKKCKSEYNETERFFYFTGCTIIPGFLTFNLRFIDLPDMFSIRSSVKHEWCMNWNTML